ncbi:hypothetical protein F6J56_05775 [Clostridium perfringens]
MILEKITVRCKRGFRTYRSGKVTADVEKDEIYEAKLYEPTEEYFAKDSKGREFLVGEISFDERNVILEEEFEFLGTIGIDLFKGEDKTGMIKRWNDMKFKNVSFNINGMVKVRLNEKAKKYLEEKRAKYGGKLVLDEEGYLHLQLWCLIQELGPIMNMCWSPIEKCEMIFDEIEIKEFEGVE